MRCLGGEDNEAVDPQVRQLREVRGEHGRQGAEQTGDRAAGQGLLSQGALRGRGDHPQPQRGPALHRIHDQDTRQDTAITTMIIIIIIDIS